MAIRFECPECGKHLSVSEDYADKQGKCKCGAKVIVPGNSEKMKFKCTQCGKGISVSKRHAGKKGKCPTCSGVISVPMLGTLIQIIPQSADDRQTVTQSEAMVSVVCVICNTTILARQSSEGRLMECPECGSFMEIPGTQEPAYESVGAAGIGSNLTGDDADGQSAELISTGKVYCPSCERKLADVAPVCTRCGIFVKSGRPILTAWDMDAEEVEEKAEGVVGAVSWLIPFGLYPVYSDAMGDHKPYATWGIAAVTVLISLWFLILDYSGSSQMMASKNLMLWNSSDKPDAEYIQMFYEFTSYGDAEAFYAKREELSKTVPENELDIAALNALTPKQQCFGKYKPYQLLTYVFLHGGIMHLAGNMLFLLVFGSRVNAAIGNIQTLILYPILAIAAAIMYLAMMGPEPPTPMLGASGAVMGLAGAYLFLFPINKVFMVIWMRWGLLAGFHLSFKCFALRGFLVVLFYIMFDVVAVSLVLSTGTAHWAHIGGFICGIIVAFGLLAGRLAYSRSDMFSLILGKYAWPIFGTPADRIK